MTGALWCVFGGREGEGATHWTWWEKVWLCMTVVCGCGCVSVMGCWKALRDWNVEHLLLQTVDRVRTTVNGFWVTYNNLSAPDKREPPSILIYLHSHSFWVKPALWTEAHFLKCKDDFFIGDVRSCWSDCCWIAQKWRSEVSQCCQLSDRKYRDGSESLSQLISAVLMRLMWTT